jgi:Fe-S-cluster containining protein
MARRNSDQCENCAGLCCRYFAFPIDTPESRSDYDDIRWFLCHEDIAVYVKDGDWYIEIKNKCRHLSDKDNKCMIYQKRPKVCRGYRHEECDYLEDEYDFDLYFTNDKQMEEYMKVRFDNRTREKQTNLAKARK